MSFDLFLCVLDQISEVAEVVQLYWMGEPLLNTDIFEMIRLYKDKTHAKIMLSTNGSLLTGHNIDLLVQSGLDEIVVSVDACDSQEVYEAIRTGGSIEKLNENISLLLRRKKDMNVVLQFIDLYINRSERDRFLTKWENKNCTVSISCLYSWINQIPSLNLASDNLSPVAKKKRVPCADLWNKMAIHWNGIVSACCFDWHSELPLGDCNVIPLDTIWNGEEINRLRCLHSDDRYFEISICNNCDSWAEPDEYKQLFNLT
jgi:MoaA/NifB/PqqE/SkfB family radical SAM enzyme